MTDTPPAKTPVDYVTGDNVWLVMPEALAERLAAEMREMVKRDYNVEEPEGAPRGAAALGVDACAYGSIDQNMETGATTTALMLCFLSAQGFPTFTDYIFHHSEATAGDAFWITLDEREAELRALEPPAETETGVVFEPAPESEAADTAEATDADEPDEPDKPGGKVAKRGTGPRFTRPR